MFDCFGFVFLKLQCAAPADRNGSTIFFPVFGSGESWTCTGPQGAAQGHRSRLSDLLDTMIVAGKAAADSLTEGHIVASVIRARN